MFAFVGQAGNAILFVCFGVLFVMLAGYVAALAARVYLLVAQGTAAGQDEVHWPDEAIADWLPQSAYLLGALAIWLIPAGLLSRWLGPVLLPDDAPLRTTVLIVLAVWLLFPPGLLFMQRPGAVVALVKGLPTVLGFYVLTGILLGALGGLAYLAMFTVSWPTVPVAAVLGSAVLLIHARLLGRLGFMIAQGDREPEAAPKPSARPAKGEKKAKKGKRVRAEVTDPWADTEPEPEPAPPPEEESIRYAVRELPPAEEAPRRRPSYEEDVPDPYAVADPEPLTGPPPAPITELRKEEIEREVALRTREVKPPPASLLFSGVWEFPFQDSSRKPLALLAIWGLGVILLARLLATLFPW